jgi:hypothetical protein
MDDLNRLQARVRHVGEEAFTGPEDDLPVWGSLKRRTSTPERRRAYQTSTPPSSPP